MNYYCDETKERDLLDEARHHLRCASITDFSSCCQDELLFCIAETLLYMASENQKRKYKPRLLTEADLRALPKGTVIWPCYSDMPDAPACFMGIDTITDKVEGALEVLKYTEGFDYLRDLGKDYVVFSAQPTEAQKKAIFAQEGGSV